MKSKLHRIFILLFCLSTLSIFSQSLGNNSCATAVVIPTTGVCVTGNNNTATSTGDGTASCFTVENGVWFRFTAPASGIVDITTSDVATNFDSQLTLYSGVCGALTELACDDQSGALPNSALIHYECLTPGQTYYVMLDGYAGDIGTFCIKLTTVSNPINDFCTCATPLPLNGTCLVNQTTIGATDGWTGIVGCQSGNNPEVWYTFVADSSSVTFNVTAGTMGGNIEMILGEAPNCSSTFTTVGSYCAPSASSHTFLNLTIGATYYLTISSSGAAGTFTICGLSSTPIPLPGQDCATAAELCSNAPFGQPTSSAGFGIQEVNPANSCWGSGGERQSRWYKFTVGTSGTLGFVIDPVVNTDDYDWAIWDITTAGCPSTLSATPNAIACNWWGTMPPTTDIEGSTGLSTYTTDVAICASQPGAVDNDAGTAGCQPYSFVDFQSGFYGPLTVQAGHTYAILIDNFSISNNGFNFSFGGTAHIGPVADFVTLKSCTSATLAGGPATSNTSYNWNFGDGSSSSATYSVAHTYSASGTYSTSLLTTDALGCTARSNDVVDLGNPSLVVSPLDTICSGATAQLLSTATPNSPQLTFSNNTATAIPNNNATGINSTIAVSGITPSTISGNQMVKVCLNIAHATDDNLDIILTCPSGNTVILTSDNGGSSANYSNTCFTGIIATPIDANITPATAPFNTGYYNAETNLNALNSCNINGNWTLNVSDDAGGSAGTLNSWSITFNTTSNTVAYAWTPAVFLSASNISNPVASPTTTTIYTVTATDGQGCATTATTQVFVKPLPVPSITSSNTLCLGSSLTFTGSGANTYTWTTGGSGGLSVTTGSIVSATPSATGNITYTATVTGTNNCVTSAIKTITVNPIPTANASVSNTLTCSNTTISLTGTGGGTYSWSGPGITSGSTTASPSVNTPGTYSLVVTSTAGCPSSMTTVAVTQNTTSPVVTSASSAVLNCTLTSVNASATTTTTPVAYNWSGTGITSATNISTITVNQPGTYNYTVTNTSNGCRTTGTQAVTQNTTTPVVTAAASAALNCTLTSVNASATTTTTPVSYNWSGTGITSAANTSTITVNQPGTFNYTVTNASNGCSTSGSQAVTQNTTAPSVASAASAVLNCTLTSVNASATTTTTPVSYNWSGTGITSATNISTITVNQPGTYNYTVTNTSNGCRTTGTQAVTQNTIVPVVTSAASAVLNCTLTSVNASATTTTTPVSYNWSGTGIASATNISTITVNQPGTFNYTVTNTSNGCSTSGSQVVTQNTITPVVSSAASAILNCTLTSVNASATTTTTPVSYNWSGTGITSATNISTITVNQPGTFNYTVTNTSNGCSASGSQAVTQNTTAPILTMPSSQTITCASPTVSLIASANPSSVTPVWTGGVCAGANSFTASACSPNTYTLTVTNNTNGCTSSGIVSVVPSTGIPSVIASNSGSITCTTTTAQIVATTTMTPVSYSWSGPGIISGASTSSGTVSVGGTYQCVVTNTTTGCTSTVTTLVPTNTAAVVATIAPTSSINCLVTSQVLNASPTGPYSYSWAPTSGLSGTTVSTPTVSSGGTYSVIITNTVNGCVGNASTTVISNTITPTVTISPSSFTTTCATPTVQLTTNTSTNSINYNWSVPASGTLTSSSSSSPIASGAGIFTVVVTNTVNGCVSAPSTSSITINNVVPTATLSSNSVSITCANPSPSVSISTSTSSVSYSWSPSLGIASGATTSNPTFTLAGTYSAVVTNTANGCVSNMSANIVTVILNNTVPTITISPSQTLTCTTPSIIVTTTVNPSAGVTYNWNGTNVTGTTTNSVAINQPGVYSTTVTNPSNGCSATTNVSISSNTTAPIVNIAVNSITTTCAVPSATLNASSTPSAGVSYNWTAPGSGSLNTFTVSNPVAGGSGIFTVTVTDNTNGCSNALSQATVEVIPDAATPVVNVSANSLTITCTNTTVTTALTSTNSIASYNWNPTPVSGGANPVFDTPGIYTATVTATNGCPTNVSVNVGIDITVPTASLSLASNNGTLTCLTTSITITPSVSPASNLTYTWSPSIGIASNSNQASVTFTAAGVYTLAITNTITGCVSSLTNTANTFTVIEDNASPSFTLGTASSVTTTCASPNATLSATSNADPNSVYVWTTPSNSTITGNPIVSSATGVYSVVVTNTINGCSTTTSSQSTVEVVADSGIPNVTLSTNSVSITCSNPTPSVSITTTASPVSYSWAPVSGIVPGTETSANPTFTAAGSYSVIVTNTISGCATSINSNIVDVTLDNTIPVITLSSSVNDGTITCTNSSITITPSVTPNSNLTYTWSPSGVISSSINDATFTAAGIYTLAITNTLTGCVNTTTNTANTFTVYLNTTTPTITTNAISSNTIIGCSNSIVSFSTNVSGNGSNLTYTWSTGVNTPTVDITSAGVYSVIVTDTDNGCSASSQFTVAGSTITPQGVNAGANTTIPCGSSSVMLTGASTSTNVNYSWSGPSITSILSGSNTTTPVVTEVGIYTLTVTDNQTGCQSTSTVNVSQTNVTAAFSANPTSGTSPLTVTFTDASSGANNWSWNFGDTSPVQTYTTNPASLSNVYTTGTYTAALTATSGSCTSTYTVLIVVEDGLTLEIPNVFTPNSDGANDIFTINSSGVKEISLQIFNRWGQILHEFTGPKASWDGLTPNGNRAPTGTYFFFVKATGFDDKVIEKNGVLSLFR